MVRKIFHCNGSVSCDSSISATSEFFADGLCERAARRTGQRRGEPADEVVVRLLLRLLLAPGQCLARRAQKIQPLRQREFRASVDSSSHLSNKSGYGFGISFFLPTAARMAERRKSGSRPSCPRTFSVQ
jgi:hypothetical protein